MSKGSKKIEIRPVKKDYQQNGGTSKKDKRILELIKKKDKK